MSSSSTDDPLILVGTLGRPHGLAGELTIWLESDFSDRFTPGSVLRTDSGDHLTVKHLRHGKKSPLIAFEEIADRDTAGAHRGTRLLIDVVTRRDLGEDEYWPEDLIGLAVVDVAGSPVGTISDVILTDTQDRIVIDVGVRRVEVPLVDELVPSIDIAGRTATVNVIDGLL